MNTVLSTQTDFSSTHIPQVLMSTTSLTSATNWHISTKRGHALLKVQGKRLVDAWYSLQLTHYGGRYSTERMLPSRNILYCNRTTSLIRVALVSIGVISLLVSGLESVPLEADPADGWRANCGLWIRGGVVEL